MRRLLSVSFALAVMVNMAAPQQTPPRELKSLKDKASYAIGFNIGSSMKKDNLELDLALLFEGLRDALENRPRRMKDAEIQAVMKTFQEEVGKREQARAKAAGDVNAKQGAAFLAANGKKAGVVTLPSGLQYKVIRKGTGPTPTAQNTVKTHYRGTLIGGTEFDSSYSRGTPAEFPVTGVIRGWTEALQKMKVGGKWMLYIPSNLAYGPRGAGGDIGPNATLIFEIELLGIVK